MDMEENEKFASDELDYHQFFNSWKQLEVKLSDDKLEIGDHLVMCKGQERLMKEFAKAIAQSKGDILEIGFGMGVSASYIQDFGPKSHTILEPHPVIFANAQEWRKGYKSQIVLINDFWQNQIGNLSTYDGIFYDSFSPSQHIERDIFTFFEVAAKKLLKDSGRLAFWYNRSDTLEPEFQRVLLKHFSSISISLVEGLKIPGYCKDWDIGLSMIVPVAIK